MLNCLMQEWKGLLATFGMLALAGTLSAQVDDRDRSFLTLGGSFNTGDADPSGSGFLYWNKVNYPWESTHATIIFAGPFMEGQLVHTGVGTPNTTVGFNAGTLVYLGGLPLQYIDGQPQRNEEVRGTLLFGELFINHEIGKYTEYDIPLNLFLGYALSYSDYFSSGDLRPDFVLPSDPIRQNVELRVQFGGRKPALRDQEALDVHLRYIYGHNSNWDVFGPLLSPYEANANYHMLIGSAGASLPVAEGHYLGAFVTGMTGWGLDRSSDYVLGGFLQRRRESTRIIGYYTSEFIVDRYALLNVSYQFPLLDWRDLAGHLYLDYAYFHEDTQPNNGWRDALGLGAGISLELPYDAELLVAYGYGVNASRVGGSGRHELIVQTEINFW